MGRTGSGLPIRPRCGGGGESGSTLKNMDELTADLIKVSVLKKALF